MTSARAAVDVARLDVPDELERRRLEQPVRLARQLVALGRLLADREQADARRARCRAPTRAYTLPITANCSRCCGPAFDARADVEQHRRRIRARRNRGGQRRPIRRRAACRTRACAAIDRRARVAGAEQRRGLAARDESAATAIDAPGLRRSAAAGDSFHRDDVRRVDDRARASDLTSRMPRRARPRADPCGPTSMTPRSKCRAAASAPSTTGAARSRRPWRRRQSESFGSGSWCGVLGANSSC